MDFTNMNLEHKHDPLYTQLYDSSFDPFESLTSVMHQTGSRATRILAHILETKQMYWNLIREACDLEPPPNNLSEMMQYELAQVLELSAVQRQLKIDYSETTQTVEDLIRLNARHTVWHAGQIALSSFE
jgi:hypothetical protein